VSTIEIT